MLVEFPLFPIHAHRRSALATRIHVDARCDVNVEEGEYPVGSHLVVSSRTATCGVFHERFAPGQENLPHLVQLSACRMGLEQAIDLECHRSRHVELCLGDHTIQEIIAARARGERHPDDAVEGALDEIATLARETETIVWSRIASGLNLRDDDFISQEIVRILAECGPHPTLSAFDLGVSWRSKVMRAIRARPGMKKGLQLRPRAVSKRLGHGALPLHPDEKERDETKGEWANVLLQRLCETRDLVDKRDLSNIRVRVSEGEWRADLDLGERFRLVVEKNAAPGTGDGDPDEPPDIRDLPFDLFVHVVAERRQTAIDLAMIALRHQARLDQPLEQTGFSDELLDILPHDGELAVRVHADGSLETAGGRSYGCVCLRGQEGIHFGDTIEMSGNPNDLVEAGATLEALERVAGFWGSRRFVVFTDNIAWAKAASYARSRPDRCNENTAMFLRRLAGFERRHDAIVDIVWIRGHTSNLDRNAIAHTLADRLAWTCRHNGLLPISEPTERWVDSALASIDGDVARVRNQPSSPSKLSRTKIADTWNIRVSVIYDLESKGFLKSNSWGDWMDWDGAARISQDFWKIGQEKR